MMLGRNVLAAASALVLALGCGESHMNGDPDAAIVIPDGALNMPDAGSDAGPPASNVGAPCGSDTDCTGPADMCLAQLGGYCTLFCTADEDCPSDSACLMVQMGVSICLASCNGTNPDDQCPAHLGCVSGGGAPPICLPGCENDTDCGDGLSCITGAGDFGAGVCADLDASLGGACTSSADCPAGAACATEADSDVPGGACVLVGCDPATNTGCPSDAQCLPQGFGGGICWDGCATDGDCRDEYYCAQSAQFPDRHYCYPRFVESNLGQVCSPTGSCAGGNCLTESFNGFPSSYCAGPTCDPSAADPGCPGDGVCARTSDGGGLCLDGCASDDDCRGAYACRPVSASDPSSPTACMPACTSDSDCTGTSRGTPNTCNPGTGLCGRPFDASTLGTPCTGVDFRECRSGRCLTADDGWPGGMCTYPGCSLSGASPSATCPSGSVCADDGGGDPDLGVCVPECTPGDTTCRTGYACSSTIPDMSGSPTGCLPAT